MSKYHYTYILIERETQMGYIGVRSCDCVPKDDNYWGSSKHLPKGRCGDLSSTFDKVIVELFSTREEANYDEIRMHNWYNVAMNPSFYNKAKATTSGFCMYGTKHTNETREKMSKSKTGDKHYMYGKHHSDETRAKMSKSTTGDKHSMYGKHHTDVTREKMSKAQTGDKHPMYGKHHSDEAREKISKARMGSTNSQRHTSQVWWVHTDGFVIYANPAQMRNLYDKDGGTSNFVNVYKGTNKTCRGWSLR